MIQMETNYQSNLIVSNVFMSFHFHDFVESSHGYYKNEFPRKNQSKIMFVMDKKYMLADIGDKNTQIPGFQKAHHLLFVEIPEMNISTYNLYTI